jgi:dipeptidyl aminopeptidase/acylaminoacyl peptidase
MTKKIFLCLIALTLLTANLFAQQTFSPERIYTTPTFIPLQKPVMLDSVNLRDTKFSDETLLATPVSFPAQERFTTALTPDTAGFFHLPKPQTERAFQLLSFFVAGNQFGKGTLTVTSPNQLELWVDGTRRTSKTQTNDSLHQAGSVNYTLNGNINNQRVVIKMLTSNESELAPAVKIEVKTDAENENLVYAFSNSDERLIQIQDILEGRRVGSSQISPKGRFVRLNISETLPGGESRGFVEIYDTRTNRVIMSESNNRQNLNWMPNVDLLTFTRDTENGRTLFTLDPLTMEIKTLAENLPRENFTLAPDGKSVFFSTRETISVTAPNQLNRLISINDRLPGNRDRQFLFRHHFDTGLTQQLTFGRRSASINDISNDVKYMLFSTSEEDLTERPFRTSSLYKLNLETMAVDTVWEDQRFISSARFSPDNTQLLVLASAEAFDGIGENILPGQISNFYNNSAFIFDLATKRVDPITKNFNPSISSQVWSRHDGHIYFRTDDRDRVTVYRYNVRTRNFELLPLKEDVVRVFNLADDAAFATYVGQSSSNSNRAYLLNLRNLQSTLISDPFAERLNTLTLGEVKDWNFTSSFGDVIEGRYILPPNFDPTKKYPLIVYYYAGTTPTTRVFESTYPLHVYAAQGFVVYTLQPSGTIGWGQEFAARHVNGWGGQTADEIIEGTKKFVAAHSFIEGSKIGNIGASYGGFMTQYLITKTDIFAASVSHAGISNITSYWGEGFWGFAYSGGASAGSFPWNNRQLYVEHSPLFHADRINTPLLLLHGSEDTNVPIGESIQMFKALKLLGRPVEFIEVAGENHSIQQYDRRIAWNHAIYAWFTKWLKDDSGWWDSMYSDGL